jgi:D-lactate dehydrogenase
VNHAKEIFMAKQQVKIGNLAGSVVGKSNLMGMTKAIHSKFKSIPIYLDTMPKVQNTKFENSVGVGIATSTKKSSSKKVLLIPACPNKIFASSRNHTKYPSQLILEKLGFSVEYPNNLGKQCCGQMYHSKGNATQEQIISKQLAEIDYSDYDFVVTDNSSCSNFAKDKGVEIVDINSLVLANIDNLDIKQKYKNIALHIDCSTRKQNIDQKYIELVAKCCEKVVTPERIYCCGFAGDKGFTNPELNSSSLENLYPQIKDCEIGVSFNRSCQIGLSHHGKVEYISFVELLLECV